MATFSATRLASSAALVGLALAVSGCQSGMTYGTGKAPGAQTFEDLVGIAALSTAQKEPIDYKPRPKVLAPPSNDLLPPPANGNTAILATNWPVDPDAQAAKIRAEAAARDAAGKPMPFVRLSKTPGDVQPPAPSGDPNKPLTPDELAAARKMFADARGGVAVDENGNPVRRYLSDPPSEYRLPDPNSPVEITVKPKKKRKFLWWSWSQ